MKTFLFAAIFSLLVTFVFEGYNWLRGYEEFSFQRELIMLITNFIIGYIIFFIEKLKNNIRESHPYFTD